MKKLELPELPAVGAKVQLPIIGLDGLPTVGEVKEVYEKGGELYALIREARRDGKIEMHEVLLIITKGVEIARMSFWQKLVATIKRIFTRKKA